MHGGDLYLVVLVATAVLLVAVVAVQLSSRTGLPSLLFYLGLGVILGESGLGVQFDDAALTQNFGLVALAVILAEGGLTTRWSTIRPILGFAVVLSTVGVFVSVGVTAAAAHLLLDFDTRTSLLLGAVLSSTDAAAVFSVLRTLALPPRLRAALEAESGLNDAPVVILVTLVASDAWESASVPSVLLLMAYELVVGVLVGLLAGRLGQGLLSRTALPAAGLYPLATIALAILSFAAAGAIHASGFIAVYLTSLWLGNAPLPHRRATLGFAEGFAWLAQIALFVLLGLLSSPSELPEALLSALVLGLAVLVMARPLSVLVSAVPFRLSWREQAFLSWAGLRGAVPIVLATIAATEGLPSATTVFNIVFVLVVVFTLLQAPLLPVLARRLGLGDPNGPRDVDVESAPLAEVNAELVQVTIPEQSRLAGVTIAELRLPHEAQVTLIVRGRQTIVPPADLPLRIHDRFLIVVPMHGRRDVEQRLRAVGRAGRLAMWHGEQGEA